MIWRGQRPEQVGPNTVESALESHGPVRPHAAKMAAPQRGLLAATKVATADPNNRRLVAFDEEINAETQSLSEQKPGLEPAHQGSFTMR